MLELLSLGGLVLQRDGAPIEGASLQRKPLALLAMLASAGPMGMTRDKVLGLLWPESDEERARRVLRQTLYTLRRDLDAPTLFLGTASLRLNDALFTSDLAAFEEAARRKDLVRAAEWYRGPFLDGFHLPGARGFEEWSEMRRAGLARIAHGVFETLARRAEVESRPLESATWWGRLADLEPLDVAPVLGAMRTLAAAGERGAALARADRYAEAVREHLDSRPEQAVTELARSIRAACIPASTPPRQGAPLPAPHATMPGPEEPAPAPVRPARGRHSRRRFVSMTIVGAVALTLVILAVPDRQPAAIARVAGGREPRIAVLPFRVPASDTSRYFAAGLTEEIASRLGSLPGLVVISTRSSEGYRDTPKPMDRVARELGADYLVDGIVRRDGAGIARVRITARLIDAGGAQVWARDFDSPVTDLSDLQGGIAEHIAGALGVAVDEPSLVVLRRAATASVEAYSLYMQGRHLWSRRTGDDLRRAIGLYERAVRLDPRFARAYAGLADAYSQLPVYTSADPAAAASQSRAAALRALEIDSGLAEAHTSLAALEMNVPARWGTAEARLLRAIALNPSYATAHHWYSNLLALQGRSDSALAVIRRAAVLDPLSPIIANDIAWTHYLRRDYDAAIAQGRRTLELHPEFAVARFDLGQAYLQKGMVAEALRELRQATALPGSRTLYAAGLACAEVRSGQAHDARRRAEGLERRLATEPAGPLAAALAIAHTCLGDRLAALRWLERAAEPAGGMEWLLPDPLFDPLRGEERFLAVARKVAQRNMPM